MGKKKKQFSDQTPSGDDVWNDTSWHGGSSHKVRCYESHPPLPIKTEQGEFVIYGGSCSYPVVDDAQVYIGFDHHMRHSAGWPWENPNGVVDVHFPVTDMAAPHDAKQFRNLVEWTALQLIAGKKVHAGCIGGHGRTGTFFAALVAHMTGDKDAIKYVRKNYCEKAVESASQVKFLAKHFGVNEVAGYKSSSLFGQSSGQTHGSVSSFIDVAKGSWAGRKPYMGMLGDGSTWPPKTAHGDKPRSVADASAKRTIDAVNSGRCIWNTLAKTS